MFLKQLSLKVCFRSTCYLLFVIFNFSNLLNLKGSVFKRLCSVYRCDQNCFALSLEFDIPVSNGR